MSHVMVDLETWGLRPGSALRSIGACVFDPITGQIGESFYRNVTEESCILKGMTVDAQTVAWWEKETTPEARAALESSQVPIEVALADFQFWWVAVQGDEFWANDPNFDEVILRLAFHACGLKEPWSYRAPRSCRTMFALAGVMPNRDVGVHHDALWDARNQAVAIHDAYVKLGLTAAAAA